MFFMGQEIEKKFLVINNLYKKEASSTHYRQGYLCTDSDRTVRIRLAGEKGFVTIKGKTVGCSRAEYEYEIPAADAASMLDTLCLHPLVEKIRYRHKGPDGKVWEIDEFLGENEGLVVAEIELADENEPFARPAWLGEEVTGDVRYYNSYLSQNPYKGWK